MGLALELGLVPELGLVLELDHLLLFLLLRLVVVKVDHLHSGLEVLMRTLS